MAINNNNVNELNSGLHTDTSPQNQPKGTYRFALNTINETDRGDEFFRSNEESNELCINFPAGFIPIGKCYIGNNETVIFLVKQDNSISEIGILKNNCTYEQHVNDSSSGVEDKLNFTVEHQIQCTYRLRRGCERTIYFTDDFNRPRYYNFDKPQDFKNDNGTWSGVKFSLFKEYSSIPKFRDIEVLDSGGLLEPGSYNISIQYLDEGLNPSEWITTSPIINIYNKLSTDTFLDIQGSINSDTDYIDFPTTTKSIKVEFDDLDNSYAFYRLAFIQATTGSGLVTDVKYTDTIPVSKDFFIYTGENAATTGTQEEILFFNEVIYRANSIEQIENRLVLANTQGKQVNFCKLQKYASRVKADMVTKKVLTNQLQDPRNTKNPTMHFGDMITGGTGYMPGEIYSFGLIYVFEDGSLSPVLHIPGKNPNVSPSMVFSPGPHTHPMDINNQSVNNRYIDNDNCNSNDYWGLDSEGIPLQNRPVRHHRFPLRSSLSLPLVEEVLNSDGSNAGGGEQSFPYYKVQLTATGTIVLPVTCTTEELAATPPCVPVSAPPFQVRVTYTVDGITETMTVNIDPSNSSNPFSLTAFSNLYTSSNIVIVKIEETDDDPAIPPHDVTSGVSPKGLTYIALPINSTLTTEGKIYSTDIMGIKFSGVDLPSLADTNGQKIIGYYIVRNERLENEKTILDTGVLVPTLMNSKYISHGLLNPEVDGSRINKNIYGLIHPEHKFNGREYNNVDYIKQEGNFDIFKVNKSKTRFQDVTDGTGYNSDVHKHGNMDGDNPDGWSLKIILRDNILRYLIKPIFTILKTDINEIFYLKALESRDINSGANTVYNIAGDNRIGIVHIKSDIVKPLENKLPYVVMGRDIADSYSNFRTLPYYKESINMELFDTTTHQGTATIFNGDTYVTPMRYVNSVFWDNRIAQRKGKTSVWNYIIGGLLVAVGAVLLIFGGSGALVIGAGIAVIGGGALFISSGIEKDALVKAYNEEYAKGLRETALDNWVYNEYKYGNQAGQCPDCPNDDCGYDGPEDEEIQWIGDCLTDLWFESNINMSLRNKFATGDAPTFLDAPGIIETGNQGAERCREYFGLHLWGDDSRYPVSKLEYHMNKKLLVYNSKRKDSREYIGHSLGEYYNVNPDYHRINKQKIYYHLPLEYDCCTECMEDFPHRWHWSEQSFQEELTDNYRTFLPNNYKDLEGETGEITNVFKIGNNLFMHTEEALWQIPRNYQERVTDQIVSFIGTGSYGEIPAQKILDDDTGSSAGSKHKWGTIKTPNGVYFPSENQRKIYEFDGKQLKPISNAGLSNWFQNNMELKMNTQYYNSTGRTYPYNDNPSNPFGTGYISTYDTKKNRIIFTKKDFVFTDTESDDFEICVNNGQVTYFPNYNQTINNYQANGWIYDGIENCRMKFEKTVTGTRTEIREVVTHIPNDTDIIVQFDSSGSFGPAGVANVKASVLSWFQQYKIDNPTFTGRLFYLLAADGCSGQSWLRVLKWLQNNHNVFKVDTVSTSPTYLAETAITGFTDINFNFIVVSTVNEATIGGCGGNGEYHESGIHNPTTAPSTEYMNDFNDFVTRYNGLIANNYSMHFLQYPIVYSSSSQEWTKGMLQSVISAIVGTTLSSAELSFLMANSNPFVPIGEYSVLLNALAGPNPYPRTATSPPKSLRDMGWQYKHTRGWNGTGDILSANQLSTDINAFLADLTTTTQVEVEVEYSEIVYEYVDGQVMTDTIKNNNSWTISYSLNQNTWTSWHSYLPNFYINVPEKFYSWIYGNNGLWKHDKIGSYQTFYGELHPFILEYVSLSNPLTTRLWEYLLLLVEVKKFNPDFNEFTDINNVFFDKLIAYNSRQCSGLMNIKVKDADELSTDYLYEQINNLDSNEIIVDRNERNWTLNNLRDIRVNYNEPIFISDLSSLQTEYFIDKILNNNSIDYEKDWSELESFRDKYLVVRLIFDNFAKEKIKKAGDTKLIMNFSVENETQSFR